MSAPDDTRMVCVAAIRGAFGVRGEIRIESFTGDSEDCFAYGPLLDEAGRTILTVTSHRPMKKGWAAKAEEIATREDAEAMKGTLLHVPRDAMPETDEDEFYLSDLEGLAVRHANGRKMGVIKRVADFGGGDLLEIKGTGPSWFLPFTKEYAPTVDLDEGVVYIDPPDGMEPDETP